jgi:hypothetical protein
MTANSIDDEDEKPLDPAVKRVEVRVRRLMLIGGLTLGIGIFAVFGAILYKLAVSGSTPEAAPAGAAVPSLTLSEMGLSADAALVSTALDGNRAAFTYRTGEGTVTVVVDLGTGVILRRFRIVAP